MTSSVTSHIVPVELSGVIQDGWRRERSHFNGTVEEHELQRCLRIFVVSADCRNDGVHAFKSLGERGGATAGDGDGADTEFV